MKILYNIAIFYLIGYISAFFMMRRFVQHRYEGKIHPPDYIVIAILSLLSWIWMVIMIIGWAYRNTNRNYHD